MSLEKMVIYVVTYKWSVLVTDNEIIWEKDMVEVSSSSLLVTYLKCFYY